MSEVAIEKYDSQETLDLFARQAVRESPKGDHADLARRTIALVFKRYSVAAPPALIDLLSDCVLSHVRGALFAVAQESETSEGAQPNSSPSPAPSPPGSGTSGHAQSKARSSPAPTAGGKKVVSVSAERAWLRQKVTINDKRGAKKEWGELTTQDLRDRAEYLNGGARLDMAAAARHVAVADAMTARNVNTIRDLAKLPNLTPDEDALLMEPPSGGRRRRGID